MGKLILARLILRKLAKLFGYGPSIEEPNAWKYELHV